MIRNLVIWLVFLCSLFALAFGVMKTLHDQRLQQSVFARHEHLINTARTLLHEHLMKAVQDTHQLSTISCTTKYLNNPTQENRALLERTLLETANIYGRYDQIRVISLQGKELVRVNHAMLGGYGVPQDQLQDKIDRYYVTEGLKLKPGQVYLSPLDLNVERGKIEKPLNPTIRLVRMMANNEGQPVALLIINYKARGMLSQFIAQFPAVDRAMLLNAKGYWLANHQSSNEWGWMLGREDLTLKQWSPALWDAIQEKRSGNFNQSGDLFTFNRVDISSIYNDTSHARYIKDLGLVSDIKASTWSILVQTDQQDWQRNALYNSRFFQFSAVFVAIALLLIMYLIVRNRHQHQINSQLQHQQLDNFKDLYENAPIGYITLSTNGLITNVNKALLGYLDYSREAIVNRLYLKDIADANSQSAITALLSTLTDSQERCSRVTMVSANGQKVTVLCNISSRTVQSHVVDMPVQIGRCSVQDISQQVRLEQRLESLAHKDPLTGLANRRYFDELSEAQLQRTHRSGVPLVAIALDIDYFKRVNDTYGHSAGDEVLKALADRCVGMLRTTDIIARFGGEEFVILLPDTPLSQAVDKANSIRKALADMPVMISDELIISFTVSFGVAVTSATENTIKKLLDAADEALYEAKNSGRNCVVVYTAKNS